MLAMDTEGLLLKCRSCGAVNRIPTGRMDQKPLCGKCRSFIEFPVVPLHVTSGSFDREVLGWPGRVLTEFEDGRCYYCRQIAPLIMGLTARLAGRVKVVKVDIQAETVLASRFGINATPTFIIFNNGTQLARIDGAPKNPGDLEMWALQAS